MSDKITLLYNVQNEVTVLPNKFIDEYMIKADGEYVKIRWKEQIDFSVVMKCIKENLQVYWNKETLG